MGVKLAILAVILQQLGTFTAGEKYSVVYPDVSSCFEGTIREPPEWLTSLHSDAKNNCTNLDNPEETSLCFKVCLLLNTYIIQSHNYAPYGSSSAEVLGLFEWEESESIQKKLEQARERLYECEKLEILVPKFDEKKCEDWEPEHQESMQKMVTCIEDSVKC